VLPHLAAEMMQLFLDEFALTHATPGKRVVLVVDGASAHRAKSLKVPERLTLVGLPAYTPELNPAERLWPLVKEGVANRTHESLASLEEAVCGRCQRITATQVAALTSYHWWPAV
jgi:transposase